MTGASDFLVQLADARARSDALFATLRPDAWLARPLAERHRLIFYLGHLEAFDRNLLVGGAPRHREFEQLFAFGIDPLDDVPQDAPGDWPSLGAIDAWRREARADVDARTSIPPGHQRIAIEHRLMHVETLSYLFEQLGPGMRDVPAPAIDARPAPEQAWRSIPAGPVTLGLSSIDDADAGWCNEYEAHAVEVPAFRIQARKTSNADWLAFIEGGGYCQPELWSNDDFAWVQREAIGAPSRWVHRPGAWKLLLGGVEHPLPMGWPVYVSHAEALAYARFRGATLPTEAQWHRAVHGSHDGKARSFPWGEAPPRPGLHGNFGFASPHPTRIGAHPAGQSAFGLDEPVGNGWEWTRSTFAPFDGFRPDPAYPGYSQPFFDGRHAVLAGASAVTALPLLRRSFRNWYQPHYRAAFATVRLVEDAR
jgi:iron(II)-dependent oxidoreductase